MGWWLGFTWKSEAFYFHFKDSYICFWCNWDNGFICKLLQIHVLVSREFLEAVDNKVLCQRPSWRVDAARINSLHDSVLLISDHSVFPQCMRCISSLVGYIFSYWFSDYRWLIEHMFQFMLAWAIRSIFSLYCGRLAVAKSFLHNELLFGCRAMNFWW